VAIVIYAPEADDDLEAIAEYIARDKLNAARMWLTRVRGACETLALQPDLGEAREGFGVPGCKSFSVGSYVLFYRSIEGGIEVARVIHGSRDMRSI
jgi:toxin ParE1/3/4